MRSPHLPQLSGIGDADWLRAQGIAPALHLPGVGRNLRDHYQIRLGHRVVGVVTLNEHTRGLAVVKEALSYAFLGRGMLTMGARTAALFHRSREGLDAPDSELVFAPGSFASPGVLEREPGMTIGGWPSRLESHGTVRLRSPDPMEPPAIAPDYLSAPGDRRVIVSCLRMIRRLFAAPALRDGAGARPSRARWCRPTRNCWTSRANAVRQGCISSAPAGSGPMCRPSWIRCCACAHHGALRGGRSRHAELYCWKYQCDCGDGGGERCSDDPRGCASAHRRKRGDGGGIGASRALRDGATA